MQGSVEGVLGHWHSYSDLMEQWPRARPLLERDDVADLRIGATGTQVGDHLLPCIEALVLRHLQPARLAHVPDEALLGVAEALVHGRRSPVRVSLLDLHRGEEELRRGTGQTGVAQEP